MTRIARAVAPEDDHHHPQIVYYQAGVGTGVGLWDRLAGGGTGLGLAEHVREAYSFLANNFRENDIEQPGVEPDSVFLIGFSRGAYTARSIGGLIGAVGILKKQAMTHFYDIFTDWQNAGNKRYQPKFFEKYFAMRPDLRASSPSLDLAHDFARIDDYMEQYFARLKSLGLTQEVNIQCIGVWDTVGALGIPVNPLLQRVFPFLPSFFREYSWFDTGLDRHVENAFQALAMDEHRAPFSPTLWEKRTDRKGNKCPTNLKQVWFPGVHSNIGGSYKDSGIANITLAWMIDQLSGNTTKHLNGFTHHAWIKFDEKYITDWQDHDLETFQQEEQAAYKGWSMGYLYQSCQFPQSLAGKRTRAPGRYHRVFYETQKPQETLLQDTNEFIHASVRTRLALSGRGVEPDWNHVFPHGAAGSPIFQRLIDWLLGRQPRVYQPQAKNHPLEGWTLDNGHKSCHSLGEESDMSYVEQDQISWKYEGSEPCVKKELREDKLGPFELKLLEKDKEIAEQVLGSWDESKTKTRRSRVELGTSHTF